MTILVPDWMKRQQNKKADEARKEANAYKSEVESIASKVTKVLSDEGVKVGDWETISNLVTQAFTKSFTEKTVKELIDKKDAKEGTIQESGQSEQSS